MKKEILFQLDIVWQLFEYHCHDLSEKEAMWCKTFQGLQIRKSDDKWEADWPDTENYAIGPASIAWIMWHIIYWWKNVLRASKNKKTMAKEDVIWPGSVELAIDEIRKCHKEWIEFVEALSDEELNSEKMCKWPFEGQTMYSLILWLNVEFMKNVAEIGSARFLYATIEQ
ncbi:DinB family protein [Diplocloster agilis]|uniref:DinB family protein n=1 Tax=Diplocloster agilis TaxID=2850323 RepID=UPI0008211DD7|nr:DinB family protein [Suonthocola fibrivorans]MCU6733663.1 DinB family protein [Suonthocola fibrivorans]SCJ03057.1 DinB superfamily [uncultured Clostridium sp.]